MRVETPSCAVSPLTAALCGGPSPASVLSAPCCCGFCHLSPSRACAHGRLFVCVFVCPTVPIPLGFVKPDLHSQSESSGAQTGSPLGLMLCRLTFEPAVPCLTKTIRSKLMAKHFSGSSRAISGYQRIFQYGGTLQGLQI